MCLAVDGETSLLQENLFSTLLQTRLKNARYQQESSIQKLVFSQVIKHKYSTIPKWSSMQRSMDSHVTKPKLYKLSMTERFTSLCTH